MDSSRDIVGYSYETEDRCRECMRELALSWNIDGFEPTDTVENLLDLAAKAWDIDRRNEGSFNSCRFPNGVIPVFPKVIFESQICQENCGDDSCDHEAAECGHDSCGSCGTRLCEQ